MTFVETLARAAWVAALLAIAGCSSMSEPLTKLQRAAGIAPAGAASAPAASASSPGVAAMKPPAEPDVPVSHEVQRAFDDARRAMQAGRHDGAEKGFRSLAQAHPELAGPHANLGILLRQGGKLPEAIAELELAAKINPNRASIFNQLGVTYRQAGQFIKAKDAYEHAIALDPAYAAALLNLGILNDLYLGDGVRALELYGKYLALTPAGDATVTKWVADLKNRKPVPQQTSLAKKEQP